MKKLLSILMVAVLTLSLAVPCFATNPSISPNTNSDSESVLLNDGSSLSDEDILNALNNAELVDASEDSAFTLADSSVEISDDYFPATANISEIESIDIEQTNEDSESTIDLQSTGITPVGETVGDAMVYYTQKWLNQEYGNVPGFGSVPENGKTGWDTVYGLLRALQHELGITNLANSFGPTTSSRYEQNLLRRQDGVTDKKFAILQGALWCKGYSPGYNMTENADGTITFNAVFDEEVENAVKQLQRDAGLAVQDGVVSLNLMKALMSMDSFKLLPSSYGSDAKIRNFQQWLNKNYEDYTGLNPCDGVYGRNTNKALIYALQAEEKLPLNIANGNFGNTTQLCCPEIPYFENDNAARAYPGTSSGELYSYSDIVNFTKLLQFALYVNGFGDGDFDGIYDNATKQAVREFQEHHAITINGKADKGTWLSLFISCGDRNRSAIAADCATILTKPKAEALYANGYRYIGRYLTGTYNGGISKALTREEAEIILAAGLHFFPIYQTSARKDTYFTPEQGTADAKAAIEAATALGIPKDTIIYFAVDFDAMDYQITSNVIPYFQAVHEEMSYSIYRTGIYGARNVCSRVSEKGYACSSFVANMSTGFSGNLGFKMPSNWAFDQFTDKDQSGNYLSISSPDGSFAIDKDGFSGRDQGVSELEELVTDNTFDTNFGSAEDDILYGPTVNIMGKEVPLFQINLSFDLKVAQIETRQDINTGNIEVLMGINVYGKESETTGSREKAEKYKEAYRNTKALIRSLGHNPQEVNNKLKDFKGSLYDRGTKVGFDFNSYVVGYMTIDKYGKIIESGVGFIGTTKGSVSYPIVPTIYFKLQIEGSMLGSLKLVLQETGQTSAFGNLDFSVRPSLGIEGNLIVASAYVGLSGELSCSVEFPFKSFSDSFEAKLNATAFFEWSALAWWGARYDWKFYEQPIYPRSTSNSLYVTQDDLQFIAPLNPEMCSRSSNNLDAFKEAMQIYAKPKIASLGNEKMFMVYIDDASDRSAENRFTLMYSVYDGTVWSTPQPVLNDGTADFEPMLCSDGNGGVHILWQNANTTFNEGVTLEQMSKSMDLYYTHWNGSTFSEGRAITVNNQNFEMSPQIVSSGNNISVIWQQNSENDPLAIDGTNSIYRRQFVNGSWQTVETIASNLPLVNSIDSDYVDGTNVVAYCAKTENETSTINDFELFCFNGTQTAQLTDDNVPDYSVNLLNNELYWIRDGAIASMQNGDANTKQIIEPLDSSVTEIKVLHNTAGDKAITWKQENEAGVTFYGVNYNDETNSFGATHPLTTDGGVVRGWDACLQSAGQIELAFCYADYLDEPVNGQPYGTLSLIQKSSETFCDVAVNPNATYSGEIEPNKEITLVTEVYNTGSQPINQFNIKILNENNDIVQNSTVNQELGIGENAEIEIPFTMSNSISRADYKIQILPIGEEDISPTDNEAVFSIGFADLSIDSVEEVRNDSGRQLKVTVKNDGFTSIGTADLQVYAESYGGMLIGTAEISSLLPGAESVFTFNLDESYSDSSVSESPKLVYIAIETSDAESNYANNSIEYYVYPDYLINVHAGTQGGTVAGSGTYEKGSNVQIIATADPGYVFQGWYENNVKIFDAESIYSFLVTNGRTLEARFVPLDTCDIEPVPTKPGVVDKENKYLRGIEPCGAVQDYFMVTNGGSLRLIPDKYDFAFGTGTQVQLLSENGTIVDVYTVVILGDINGDSAVDAFDAAVLSLYLGGFAQLDLAYLEAADLNQDGTIDERDYQTLRNMLSGTLNNYRLFPKNVNILYSMHSV